MRGVSVLALLLLSMPVLAAEEPSGCDKFKWNIDRERAALTASDRTRLTPGAELNVLPASGVILSLAAPAEAKLPTPPEGGTFAGFASFKAAPKAGVYTISLSAGAWIDVLQDGDFVKPMGFSGAKDCEGIRKTIKYELSAKPFVLQVSGSRQDSISIAVLPSGE